ncbi:hypothetical protein MNBD_CHLOROFLEXI01-813 [hydrothermal vent metagenome]|uniref:Coenzyme PQQ synthesis protein D (PqqD) n=1 Tax=hydrothermal vent metagenome TaxID=652676 RepID=A0A3B0VGT3_9ZZZZ
MDKKSVLQQAESVTFEVVADEAILIDINTGTYFSLNEIGTEFWEMLDGRQTIEQQAATLAAKYEVAPEMVVSDLLELAEEMAKDNLITIS